MNSPTEVAALALANGDPLTALNHVALLTDPQSTTLRAIALAQLGELQEASRLLANAISAFESKEELNRARAMLALADIQLVLRDFPRSAATVDAALPLLVRHGDERNATFARLLSARHSLLRGEVILAAETLGHLEEAALSGELACTYWLLRASIQAREFDATAASASLHRALALAESSTTKGLAVEVRSAIAHLARPIAYLSRNGSRRLVALAGVQTVLTAPGVVIDDTRRAIISSGRIISLASRPMLFKLLIALGETWPRPRAHSELIFVLFGARHIDESHSSRLRVDVTRLRRLTEPMLSIQSERGQYRLLSHSGPVSLLMYPWPGLHGAAIHAILADGELWSASALGIATGLSSRTVQRVLRSMADAGIVVSFGPGRSRRWRLQHFPTLLQLPLARPLAT